MKQKKSNKKKYTDERWRKKICCTGSKEKEKGKLKKDNDEGAENENEAARECYKNIMSTGNLA